jgi:hypothetical protein
LFVINCNIATPCVIIICNIIYKGKYFYLSVE